MYVPCLASKGLKSLLGQFIAELGDDDFDTELHISVLSRVKQILEARPGEQIAVISPQVLDYLDAIHAGDSDNATISIVHDLEHTQFRIAMGVSCTSNGYLQVNDSTIVRVTEASLELEKHVQAGLPIEYDTAEEHYTRSFVAASVLDAKTESKGEAKLSSSTAVAVDTADTAAPRWKWQEAIQCKASEWKEDYDVWGYDHTGCNAVNIDVGIDPSDFTEIIRERHGHAHRVSNPRYAVTAYKYNNQEDCIHSLGSHTEWYVPAAIVKVLPPADVV